MWNPSNNWFIPNEFLDVLMNDEEDSGSELGDLGDDVDEQMKVKVEHQAGEYIEVEVDIKEMLDVENIAQPALPMDDNDGSYPISSLHSTMLLPRESPSSSHKSDSERYDAFYSTSGHKEGNIEVKVETPYSSALKDQYHCQGQVQTRGLQPQGGNQGRERPAATSDVKDETGWPRDGCMNEVCLDDEDVPQKLQKMIHEHEVARHARSEHHKRLNVRPNEESDDDDEYYDAQSFVVNELFSGDNSALDFQWSPMATFKGKRERFQLEHYGPRYNFSCGYEAFRQFWDDCILEHIVSETNRYAMELKSSSERFVKDWYDTNIHEILILFAFWMMLDIIRIPSIKSCFSNSPLLKTSIFRTLMTESRYWILNRALHFVDNATRNSDSSQLFSLGPVVDHLNNKFMDAYIPGQDITINESLILGKSDWTFRQYLKTRAEECSIKTFELCESATGYLWSFLVNIEKDNATTSSKLFKYTEFIVHLIKPLLNKGYRLFLNDWYTSPLIARFLKRNQTDCIGTLQKSRKNVPTIMKLAKIPDGTCLARHSGDVVVMAYQDRKAIYTISTCHGTESVPVDGRPGRPLHYKPAVIVDYNSCMRRVEKKDYIMEPYLIERNRFQKWYKRIFKRLLNVSICNSHILVDSNDDQTKQLAFRLDLVNEIMKRHLAHVPQQRQRRVSNKNVEFSDARFIGTHFIVRAEVNEQQQKTAGTSRTSKNRRYCIWCTVRQKRHSKTVWICEQCAVPLCLDGCFKKYHTEH